MTQTETFNKTHLTYFSELLGERCFFSEEIRTEYGHDETEDILVVPDVVLKPQTPKEVSSIMKYCFENEIPVTPSGARTGLSGGAIPVNRGVALSMEKFNKILNIDEKNHQVITEP